MPPGMQDGAEEGAPAPAGTRACGPSAAAAGEPRTARHALRTARSGGPEPDGAARRRAEVRALDRALDRALVCVRDLAGRLRGTGFLADHEGTVVTSHEAVDGLSRLVLHVPGGGDRSCLVTADAVTALPALDLALVRTEGLGARPLPVSVRDGVATGAYVRIAAGGWREARVLGACSVTYTSTDRFHLLKDALELAIGTAGRDALGLGGGAAGGPVVDAATGAVVAVLGTALQSGRGEAGHAVPLRREGALAGLLGRNAATVPAYGPDLNLAAVLELTATALAQDGPRGALPAHETRPGTFSTPTNTSTSTFTEPPPLTAPAFPHPGAASGPAPGAARPPLDRRPATETTEVTEAAEAAEAVEAVEAAEAAGAAPGVRRDAIVREWEAFAGSRAPVLGLVGLPGSGRTTELAALAARRARGDAPAPTLWLRGADLEAADTSVADAAGRALDRAARIVAASRAPLPTELGDLTPERVARLARAHGRPLLLLLDGPEEMPRALADRLAEWTERSAHWLRATGARLVVACREAYWEGAGAHFPAGALHTPAAWTGTGGQLPPCLPLDDLTPEEAREVRARLGVPDGALVAADARHPLTLRLLSEVRAALPGDAGHPPLDRHDVLAAHLDLMCLRVAVRLAAENGLRGTAVRRLAAKVAGQVHEAARRSLGPGRDDLDRAAFEEVFPWGPAPARLGGGTGWASAVLTEGLLVPAGDGYRFAHEELADWLQGTHLDLDEALRVLVRRRPAPGAPRPPLSVPHHRIGPVVQALLLLARQHGTRRLAARLEELVCALDADPRSWWASRLPAAVLLRVPDATPYVRELRLLADRIVAWKERGLPVPHGYGPGFWTALPLTHADRCDLLRRLLPADEAPAPGGPHRAGAGGAADAAAAPSAPGTPGAPVGPARPPARYLDAAAQLLAADPAAVQPQLTRWFDDERPLPAAPRATVATAAQALLHTHRSRALDELIATLAECGHRRAGELLAALAEEEPSALCRAVERWAHDERPARRTAAMAHGLRTAPHARTEADRELLRHAAATLLARPADAALHGAALALLVGDDPTRAHRLRPAPWPGTEGGTPLTPGAPAAPAPTPPPGPAPSVLGERVRNGPGPVASVVSVELGRDRAERRSGGAGGPDGADDPGRPDGPGGPDGSGGPAAFEGFGAEAGGTLRALAEVVTPALARRITPGVRDAVARRPETAGAVAAHVHHRLDHGPAARDVLFPLVTGLLQGGPEPLRAALAGVLATPGPPASRALRRELLDLLLAHEEDPAVLDAVLHAAAVGTGEDVRDVVHRVGLLLVRTPEGATVFDRGLVELGRHVPGFAARTAGWLAEAPKDWAAVVGPSARRMIENMAGVHVPA
ncbi:trypsin-like peptidase domain-containing protein [Streptomyces sp. NPDC004065]|uniref:trypsin-like peptidase domain-containing protein n=1 Tax=Streptomyces sp. NPDC004065 TaxID=3364689 RepID=UPI00384CE656